MYSYEIRKLLEEKNYLISSDLYDAVFDTKISTQITNIKYHPEKDIISVKTDDNYYFEFRVEYKPLVKVKKR